MIQAAWTNFGYTQTLDRSIGKFASFAAGVSYISILTGVFQLFYFGFSMAGPAYAWSWPIVFVGQLMVALCFAELAGRYPVAGSVYNWAKRLGVRDLVLAGRLAAAAVLHHGAGVRGTGTAAHPAAALVRLPVRR